MESGKHICTQAQHLPQASLLLAVTLQLLFGEALSRLFRRDASPFLACLSIFCLLQCALRALLPTVVAPLAMTGRVQRTQTWAVLAVMLALVVAFTLALPTRWLDVDVQLGARALEATGAFWSKAAGAAAHVVSLVRARRFPDAAEFVGRGGSDAAPVHVEEAVVATGALDASNEGAPASLDTIAQVRALHCSCAHGARLY